MINRNRKIYRGIALVVGCLILIMLALPLVGGEKKFRVAFTITFNEMTLAQAAEQEKKIRQAFESADQFVDVTVDHIAPINYKLFYNGTSIMRTLPYNSMDSLFFSF